MKPNFKFADGLAQINQKISNAGKNQSEWSKYELHKYMTIKFRSDNPTFNSFVGDYDVDSIDIEGMSLSKGQAVVLMKAMLDKAKVAGMPFTKLIQTHAEVAVSPVQYTVTDKIGSTKTIPQSRGIPATENPATIVAHQNVTLAMLTGTPEHDKTVVESSSKRVMARPVSTDPEGVLYPKFNVMNLVDELAVAYHGASTILDVRARLLSKAESNGNTMDIGVIALAALDALIKNEKKKNTWKEKWAMFDCVQSIPEGKVKSLYEEAGVFPIQAVPQPKTPVFKVTGIDEMYSFIDMHRTIRGSDSGKISPLTHAVYYGELDHYYRQVTSAADVLQVQALLKCNAVNFSSHNYFGKTWNVLQLNTPVFSSQSSYPYWAAEDYGCFRCPKEYKGSALTIDCLSIDPPTKNSKTKMWEYTPTREVCKERITQFFESTLVGAMKIYPYPDLWEDFPHRVYPSLHAHSGVVWVLSTPGSPYTLQNHVDRVNRANVLKTYYPCMLKKFFKDDIVVYPTVFVKRSTKRINSLGFEVMFEPDNTEIESAVDFGEISFKQRKIAQAEAKVHNAQPEVKKFNTMLADLTKKLAEEAKKVPEPSPSPQPQTKKTANAIMNDLELDDENAEYAYDEEGDFEEEEADVDEGDVNENNQDADAEEGEGAPDDGDPGEEEVNS